MSQDTEASFQSSLRGFRWAQGRTDDSPAGRAASARGNGGAAQGSWLSSVGSSLSGYVPLRSNARSDEEEAYMSLNRWERLLGFLACILGSAVCFSFSIFMLTWLRFRKFALAFSMGSLLFMAGFSVLSGPVAHFKHITSRERIPFTAAYIISLALTLYFALGPRWALPSLISAVVQIVALLSYLAAYFPGGITTLKMGGSWLLRGGASMLPI